MASSPTLKSPELSLVPFTSEFITARYIGWLNDAQLMQFSRQRFLTHTAETCLRFLQSFENSPSYFWAIASPDLGHIGNLTANVDVHNQVADLTIMVGEKNARGKGLGLAAWKIAMHYLLNDAGYRKVTAGTMATNTPMINIMQRSGMVEDGCRARQFLYNGQEVDCVMYAKFASPSR